MEEQEVREAGEADRFGSEANTDLMDCFCVLFSSMLLICEHLWHWYQIEPQAFSMMNITSTGCFMGSKNLLLLWL